MTEKKDDGDKEPVVALFGDSFGPSVTYLDKHSKQEISAGSMRLYLSVATCGPTRQQCRPVDSMRATCLLQLSVNRIAGEYLCSVGQRWVK